MSEVDRANKWTHSVMSCKETLSGDHRCRKHRTPPSSSSSTAFSRTTWHYISRCEPWTHKRRKISHHNAPPTRLAQSACAPRTRRFVNLSQRLNKGSSRVSRWWDLCDVSQRSEPRRKAPAVNLILSVRHRAALFPASCASRSAHVQSAHSQLI